MFASRRRVLQLAGLGGFAVLTGRTAWLQVVDGPDLAAEAKKERTVSWVDRARRGPIVDRDGTILASSTTSYDIGVNQVKIAQYVRTESVTDPKTGAETTRVVGYGAAAAADQMAELLGKDKQELGAAMVGESTYAVIAQDVAPDTWRKINALSIPGVEPDQRTRRTYPSGTVAGNVIGYTYEGEGRTLIGSAGLELTQNSRLTGKDGKGSVEIGKTGQIIPTGDYVEVSSVPGQTVRMTINADLQAVAQQAIDEVVTAQGADWGSVVVMEPKTGKLLVMADSHAVDPADPGKTDAADRNARTVQAIFEPGSVGKVITFAAALEEGTINTTQTWDVPYSWTAPNGQSFHDSHEHEDQVLTAAEILAESSNVGTVQVGDTVDDQVRYDYMRSFGVGEVTGIEMPAESAGLISKPSTWDDRTRYTTMFGQGIAGTALQAVQVLATVANKGVRVAPRVIDAWIDSEGNETAQSQPEGVRVISEKTASTLTEMLIGVTQSGGTAEAASLDGYLVAGKTGTTEILTESGTVASFVGFTPARDPAIAVSVIVYRPGGIYGGTVSAPVFRKIALAALHHLGIAPDPSVIAAQAAAEADAQAEKATEAAGVSTGSGSGG